MDGTLNTDAARNLAHQLGRARGADDAGWAGLCPYDHHHPLRREWLIGFSQGRVLLRDRAAASRRPDVHGAGAAAGADDAGG